MNTQLLAIAPNDLEILFNEALSIQEIEEAAYIKAKLDLKHHAPVLEMLLTKVQSAAECLNYALVAEFPFAALQDPHVTAHYNPVTCVVAISHALDEMGLEQFKQRYHPAHLQQAKLLPEAWGNAPEQEQAELLLSFTQLQNFYRMACEHNYAVISLHNQNNKPPVQC